MRVYTNFAKGTLTNSPGGAGTSFQSAEFAALPVVASPDVLTLVLDPLEETGAPEVLLVTAHTAASTTCTVTRAQEGSAARTAAAGMRWIAGLTKGSLGARGVLGRAILGTNQSTSGATVLTVTSSALTLTAETGRIYRLDAQMQVRCQTSASRGLGKFSEGGTELGRYYTSQLGAGDRDMAQGYRTLRCPDDITVGSHNLTLTFERPTGTGSFDLEGGTLPGEFTISDVGTNPG